MGWLQRLLGQEKSGTGAAVPAASSTPPAGEPISPERKGLNGEYDQSGLAKRVAAAFDSDAGIDDIETLWVAQTGSTVVLKGTIPDSAILVRIVEVAGKVDGATAVDTSQVKVGG